MSSSTIVRRGQREARLREGIYNAEIESVEVEDGVTTPYGVRSRFKITFNVNGVGVRRIYNKSLHPSSALYALINELVGEVPDEYDVADLEGMQCQVKIAYRTTASGDVWENIDRVMKPARSAGFE